jgi:glycosyltransferase involved in cell wall biosynthesis
VKIIFFCGSLAYGIDGVGDYTRRLAGELIRQGHFVKLLAFNDKSVDSPLRECQESEKTPLSVYRLPSSLSEKKRIALAFAFITEFNPQWISLQYVHYSFQDKGLPFLLAFRLRALGTGKKWHIMFHELWVGNETLKNSVISIFQKILIKNLLFCLTPVVVHTHLPVYFKQLKWLGQTAKELPLFSNIPVVKTEINNDTGKFTLGFFSQAIITKDIIDFITKVRQQLAEVGKDIQILFIGGSEAKMRKVGDAIEQKVGFKNKIQYTGYLSPEEVSTYLQTCNLGITPLPLFTLGKSGSVAAFLSHQIPIAVPTSDRTPSTKGDPFFSPALNSALLLDPDLSKLPGISTAARLAHQYFDLTKIAEKFSADLT